MPGVKTIKNEELFADVKNIIGEGGRVHIRVKGESMRPFLRGGRDTVCLAPISGRTPERGMVVLFEHGGRHVLHRIRKVRGSDLIIRGDGNYRTAEKSDTGHVLAYVESIGRGEGVIAYRSLRWRWLTFVSLAAKILRRVRYDLGRMARGVIGIR